MRVQTCLGLSINYMHVGNNTCASVYENCQVSELVAGHGGVER